MFHAPCGAFVGVVLAVFELLYRFSPKGRSVLSNEVNRDGCQALRFLLSTLNVDQRAVRYRGCGGYSSGIFR